MVLYISDEDVKKVLDVPQCVRILDDAFRGEALGQGMSLPRQSLYVPGGRLRVMSGWAPDFRVYGLKIYLSGNLILLYGEGGQGLQALVEARDLSQIRTGAAGGLAAKYLARDGAQSIGVIGAGRQGFAQVEATLAGLPNIKLVKGFSRRQEHRDAFAAEVEAKLGVKAVASDSAEECVRDSDIVITATGANEPLLDSEWLKLGAHINAIGATNQSRREVDEKTVGRCDTVVVENIEQAKEECAELQWAEVRGFFHWSSAIELRYVVAGLMGRRSQESITMFNALGVALEDVAAAGYVLQRCREVGLGVELPLKVTATGRTYRD